LPKLTSEYNLKALYPSIAKKWHKTKNKPSTPKEIYPFSSKKVWWKCSKGHEWEATVASLTYQGSTCPECSGHKVGQDNNLKKTFPNIAKEWHPTKNKNLTPKDITQGSNKRVWWKCKEGHVWDAVVYTRTQLKSGCPKCYENIRETVPRKAALKKKGSLKETHPEIAEEWHPVKNKKLTSKDITYGSGEKVWWKCKKKHEWPAQISSRTIGGNGCPKCTPNISKVQIKLYCELKTIFKNIKLNKKIHGISCDIYLPNKKIAIEYDGFRYHDGNKGDRKKNIRLHKKNITLFRVREFGLRKISSKDIVIHKNEKILEVIKRLLESTISHSSFSSSQTKAIKEYIQQNSLRGTKEYKKLIACLPGALPEESLRENFPQLLNEWNYKKNQPLTPDWCHAKSNYYVWWTCKKGHEWETPVFVRTTQGSGCPECSGRRVGRENNLKVNFPKIANEWHPTKNKTLTAKDVTSKSGKKVWWQCSKSHEWKTMIALRTGRNSGCPECSGNQAGKDNNLKILYPKVAKEWHKTKNKKLTPQNITPGSSKKVWWKCSKGHEWEAIICDRKRGVGCPVCSNYKVGKDNNLNKKFPKIAKEWHPNKNGQLTPEKVVSGSHKKVWWQCSKKKHEWEAVIKSRTQKIKGTNCPYCYENNRTQINQEASVRAALKRSGSLYDEFKSLTKEWHPTKNGDLTPKKVTFGSHKNVWWQCKANKNHVWEEVVKNRTRSRKGCPHCYNERRNKAKGI
jgi:hypothetical protein